MKINYYDVLGVSRSASEQEIREHVGALREAGATWVIVVPAGPADRVELIAGTVRTS